MSWQAQRETARRRLHEAASVAARYFAPRSADSIPCSVRVLEYGPRDTGEVEGMGFAVRSEQPTEVVFLREEVDPEYQGRVVLPSGEEYRVERVLPPHGITVNCEVVQT